MWFYNGGVLWISYLKQSTPYSVFSGRDFAIDHVAGVLFGWMVFGFWHS